VPDQHRDTLKIIGRIDEIVRHVEGIDRLEQKPDPRCRQLPRGKAQILRQHGFQRFPRKTRRRNSCQTVHLSAPRRLGIGNRRLNARPEFLPPIRQASKAAIAGIPISGWEIEQRLRQAIRLQQLSNGIRRHVIGADIFDRLEPIRSRRRKALGKRQLGIEH
jgi:hypothetical protein